MKIIIFCPYNIFLPGGVQELVLASQVSLTKRGHEVYLVTPRPRKVPATIPDGIYFLGNSRRIKAQASQVDISTCDDDEAAELLAKLQPDVIHVHEPLVPFVARSLIMQANCPIIGTFHAALPETLLAKSIAALPYIPSVTKYLDIATIVSPVAGEHVAAYMPKVVYEVPNGIDIKKFQLRAVERQPRTILFIGRLEKRKGVRYLLDALAVIQAAEPKTHLIIAGDGPLRRSLERYAKLLELKHVNFVGFVSDNEKIKLLNQATVFTSPAIYGESFGIVLLEAMAAGTPVVAHPNPGYSSVLTGRGRLGLVNVRQAEQYARTLASFLDDAELCRLWRKWSVDYVKQYAFESIIEQYETIYKKALKK